MPDREVESSFRPLDPMDVGWVGIEYARVVNGLEVPEVTEVRRALSVLGRAGDVVGREYDPSAARYRVLTGRAFEQRLSRMVVVAADDLVPDVCPPEAQKPLEDLPFRIVLGSSWVGIRVSHALGDGWSCLTLLAHVLEQARSTDVLTPPWRVLGPASQNVLSAAALARRPRVVLRAVRLRERYRGGAYEPAAARTTQHHPTTLVRVSPPGHLDELGRQRDLFHPGASVVAVVLRDLRAALTTHLAPPEPGVEMLFETRRGSRRTRRAFGNWAAGITIHPEDDLDPTSITDTLRAARDSGLPYIAAAVSRLRARRSPHEGRRVRSPSGRPHLTLSYIHRHGPLSQLPWAPGAEHGVSFWGHPNGLGTLSVSAHEVGGRLALSVAFYEHVWPREAVAAALADALDLRSPELSRHTPQEATS